MLFRSAKERPTLQNCGYQMPLKFLAFYDDSAFGSTQAGKTVDDSKDAVAGKGSSAATTTTDGSRWFLYTWIGDL